MLKAVFVGVGILAAIIAAAIWAGRSSPSPSASESPTLSPTASASASVSIPPNAMNDKHEITIVTTLGTIVFRTYDADAPKTVANFVKLANEKFYDNLIFHRVIDGFMIQGGDPKGTGMGGPGYTFADELNPDTESYQRGYVPGTVAMANAGPNTNGSQFFIMQGNTPLPHDYTIFGHVVSGQDVVDAIAAVKVDANDKPLTPVVMKTVTVKALQ